MSTTAAGFERVLAKFSSRLTRDEVENFRFTDLKDVQQAILDVQEEQAKRKGMRNLTRVTAFVEAMEQFGKVVEVFLNTSSILCFVWGPIKFLLQVASVWSESFDVLLDAYEQISENIPLLLQYRSLFETSPEMGKVLEMIYEDILEFHQSALRMFGKSTLQQLFRSAWKDFKSRFQHILGDLQRHKILIESQANILQMRGLQEARAETVESLSKLSQASILQVQEALAARTFNQKAFMTLVQAEKNDQFVVVQNWLSAVNTKVDQDGYAAMRFGDTGHWILKNDIVKAWMDPENASVPIVWLTGIPGAGKTILASRIIEDAQNNLTASVLFFYFKHRDRQRSTFVSAACSVLAQLLAHSRDQDLLPFIHAQSLDSGELTLQSLQLCKSLLTTVLDSLPMGARIFMVLDGVDECDPVERRVILSTITSIIKNRSEPAKYRVLFVSQYEPDIKGLLRSAEVIRITNKDNEDDINDYTAEWISKIASKFKNLPTEKQQFIKTTICDRAEGMFLFAKLVLRHLYSQTTLGQLYRELLPERFPKGLDQAITEHIYSDENTPEQMQAQKLLAWIICAKRPLKWHEIQGAMSIDVENQIVDFEEGSLVMDVEELCGSLVERLPGDRIELVHSTAKIYLVQDNYIRMAREEGKLATLCMQYLTFEPFCQDSPLSDNEFSELVSSGYFAFQDYATLHWVNHLECFLKTLKPVDLEDLENLGMIGEDFLVWHGTKHEPLDETSPELQVECDQVRKSPSFETFQSLIHHARHLRAQTEDFTALGTVGEALSNTRKQIEKILLSVNIDPDLRQKLEKCYGKNLYKCPRHVCFYFHEGYQDPRSRDQHVIRHDRPFCCSHDGCSRIQTGFSTKDELKKHLRKSHLDQDSLSLIFQRPQKVSRDLIQLRGIQKHPPIWQCTLCPKKFTRSYSLKAHLRTHTDERPFECTVCGKAFSRRNDQKRHEDLHSGFKAFVCKGVLSQGRHWGCGRKFSRAHALRRHLCSKAGRICIKTFLDEEALQRQRESNELESAQQTPSQHINTNEFPDGDGNYRLPAALLAQCPAIANLRWDLPTEMDEGTPLGQEEDHTTNWPHDEARYDGSVDAWFAAAPHQSGLEKYQNGFEGGPTRCEI